MRAWQLAWGLPGSWDAVGTCCPFGHHPAGILIHQYSLVYNAESDHGRGPWSWVMDLNFLLRCAFSLAIVGALVRVTRPDARPRGGLALLIVWAVCSGLLAFFADDLQGQHVHGSGSFTWRWPPSRSSAWRSALS
jgi:hypothetical protein